MRNRERVMLGSAAVLVAALIAVALWPSRETSLPAAAPAVRNAGPGPVTASAQLYLPCVPPTL